MYKEGCGGQPLLFPPLSPFGITALFKKDIYWAMHFLVHLWHQAWLANQSNPKKREEEEKGKGGKKKMKAAFKKFILSSLLLIPYCLVPINGAGILWELSIYHSWDFHVSAVPQKKVRQLSDMLLKATNVQHKHREFNAGFFFPLAVLQLLSFCLAMQHTQKGTKQKIASMFNSRLASTESSAPHKSSAQKSHLLLEA